MDFLTAQEEEILYHAIRGPTKLLKALSIIGQSLPTHCTHTQNHQSENKKSPLNLTWEIMEANTQPVRTGIIC